MKTSFCAYILGEIKHALQSMSKLRLNGIQWTATGAEATIDDAEDGQKYKVTIKPIRKYLLYLKNNSETPAIEKEVYATDKVEAVLKLSSMQELSQIPTDIISDYTKEV